MEPPVISHSGPLQSLKGIFYAFLLLASSFLGTYCFLMPLMPLALLQPSLFRLLTDFLIGFWLVLPSSLTELLFGVHIHVYGDRLDRNEPAMLIMNHRTRLDWLFFWNALWRMDPWLLTTGKISLKGPLMFIPGAGWAMATKAFLFLNRSFASDQNRIDTMIHYYSQSGRNYQLLLFPEGTDKCPIATEKSRKFAEKNGLIHYDYVLHPRTLGFVYLLQRMQKEKCLESIYDITVAYGGSIIQSEVDLVARGLAPGHVYYFVRKIPISTVPSETEHLEEWIKTKWAEKEELLRNFYSTGKFSSGDGQPLQHIELTPGSRLLYLAVLCIWLALTAYWTYFFFSLPSYMRWGSALFMISYFVGLQLYYGGFELFLAHLASIYRQKIAGGKKEVVSNGKVKMNGTNGLATAELLKNSSNGHSHHNNNHLVISNGIDKTK